MSDDPLDVSDPGSPAGDDDTLDDPQDLLDRVKRAQALHGEGDVGDDSPSATGEASADPETSEEPDDDHTVIPDEATMSRLRLSLTESRAQAESDLSSNAEHTIAGGGGCFGDHEGDADEATVARALHAEQPPEDSEDEPPPAPTQGRRRWLAAAAVALAGLGLAAWAVTTRSTSPTAVAEASEAGDAPAEDSAAAEAPATAAAADVGGAGDATTTQETSAFAATGDDLAADEGMVHEGSMTPGEGVSVTMGQANWSTGYFQAQLYRQLLEELGYTVSDPAELELGPNLGYIAMAEGQMDFWANSWYPGHLAWLAGELPDGSLVGDHLTVLGEEMIAGGLQGFLVTKSFADEFGVYTMDALNSNADALAAFDETDPVPGNGIADIFGCPESWTCDNIITNQILFSGWDNINQTIAGYDAMFAQAVDSANEGVPMVAYTWTPSAYITQLRPGDNVYWMGVDDILDDSNPSGTEGGEEHSQRGEDGTGGYAAIGPDQCPSAADNADGLCPIGWIAADILVTANNDFLAANPAAASLLEAVKLSVIEVSLANVEQGEGAAPGDLATDWIANNRATVDAWLDAARADAAAWAGATSADAELVEPRPAATTSQASESVAPERAAADDDKQEPSRPGRPRISSVDAGAEGWIEVRWSPPTSNGGASVTEYQVQLSGSAGRKEKASRSPHQFSGLQPGKYSVKVQAKNSVGWGGWSSAAAATVSQPAPPPCTAPDAPGRPSASGNTSGWVDVSWSAPSGNGCAVTGYQVSWSGVSSGSASAASTSYRVSNLSLGDYSVQVRARNSEGWGGWSSAAAATVSQPAPPPCTAPDAPGRPSASGNTSGWVDVSWSAPSGNGCAVTGYQVSWSGVSSGSASAASTSYRVSNLSLGDYSVQVRARNSEGWGGWSSAAAATVSQPAPPPCTAPDAPGRPSASGNTSGWVDVSWSAPSGNGCAVTGYQVSWSGVSSGSASAASTSYRVSNLSLGDYSVQVRARNSEGWGGWSSAAAATVSQPAPPPCTAPDAPGRPSASGNTSGWVDVSWSAPSGNGCAVTGYQVSWSGVSSGSASAASTSYRVSNLSLGDYSVQVRARNSEGWGGWSSAAAATVSQPAPPPCTAPDAPGRPSASGNTSGWVDVSWSAPSGNGCAVTGYQVSWSGVSSGSASAASTSYRVSNLSLGDYSVQVRARNSEGWGGWSSAAAATVSQPAPPPCTAPDAPGRPSVSPGGGKVTVSWSAPDDNGCEITRYEAEWRRPGRSWTSRSKDDLSRSFSINGAHAGVTYEARVKACNSEGCGSWSRTGEGTTPPTLTVRRGTRYGNSGSYWVVGSGTGWPAGEEFWIKCGNFVDTSRDHPVKYRDRFVDANGNLSWGLSICYSNISHVVEVWTKSGARVRVTIPAP